MKNITKRKDGRFMAHLQINGNRVYAYGRTQKQAIDKLKKLRKKALNYEKQSIKYNFEQWSNYWLKNYKEPFLKNQNYNSIVQLFKEINKNIGEIDLKKLQTNTIQIFYNKYEKSRKKEKIILYINACLQKAVDIGIININPCRAVVKDKKIKYNEQPFTIEEQEKIINSIKDTDIECYIYLYLLTGIRRNEINNNITSWLNTKNNQLKAINEKQKSGQVEYKYIDLSPEYVKLLLSQKDKFYLKPDNVYKKFKKVLSKLNIEGHIHKCRHTFATNYYYLGVPLKTIQLWCGHKTPTITEQVYIGTSRENIKEKLIKLYGNLLYKF